MLALAWLAARAWHCIARTIAERNRRREQKRRRRANRLGCNHRANVDIISLVVVVVVATATATVIGTATLSNRLIRRVNPG